MKAARTIGWIGTAILAATWTVAVHAQSASTGSTRTEPSNIEKKSPEGIEYLAGGVGTDEQELISQRAKDYNLKVVFTLNEGNYLADVGVTVKDAKGRAMIEDVAPGPFFLAKLPPGQYTVTASYEGKALTRKVQVGKGQRTEYLRWPANPEVDNPLPREQAARN